MSFQRGHVYGTDGPLTTHNKTDYNLKVGGGSLSELTAFAVSSAEISQIERFLN